MEKMKYKAYTVMIVVFAMIFCYSLSTYKRSQQLDFWIKNKSEYFAKDYLPSVSTMDAYYFLRFVDEKYLKQNVNMFSKLLTLGYKYFDSEGFDKVFMGSIKFSNVIAGLFLFPLILYIYSAGGGLGTGVFGALFGTFSMAYYVRSSTGRVDTDGVLMFLSFSLSLMALLIVKSNRWYLKYILASIMSFSLYKLLPLHQLVVAVYSLYLFLIIFGMFINKEKIYNIIGVSIVYIVVANPIKLWFYMKTMFKNFRNIYVFGQSDRFIQTVEETKIEGIKSVILNISDSQLLFYMGILGVILLFIMHFRKMIFLLPIFALSLFSFNGSIRLTMFLAPFVGAGIGYLICLGIDYALKYLKKGSPILQNSLSFGVAVTLFFMVKSAVGYDYIPKPSLNVKTVEMIIDLKEKLLPNSAIFSWWDLGYPLETVGGFKVYGSGAYALNSLINFPLATGLLSKNDEQLYRIASNLFNRGYADLNPILKNKDKSGLDNIMNKYAPPIPKKGNFYVMYTDDMIGKLYSISKFAQLTVKEGEETYYNELKCSKFQNNIMYCDKFDVDMKNGLLLSKGNFQKIPLYKISRINNGYEIKSQIYSSMSKYYISVLTKGNDVFKVLLYTHDMANTVFHQQYIEGRSGKNFTEVYNNYPFMRVFRFNPEVSF